METKKKRLNSTGVMLPEALKAEVKQWANDRGISFNAAMTLAARLLLIHNPETKEKTNDNF